MYVYQLLKVMEHEQPIRIIHPESEQDYFIGMVKDCQSRLILSLIVQNITSNPNNELVITV